jgi:hypothetical protein
MSRSPARFTQADVARAIRAAKQAGAGSVEIKADGTICVKLSPESTTSSAPRAPSDDAPVDDGAIVVM